MGTLLQRPPLSEDPGNSLCFLTIPDFLTADCLHGLRMFHLWWQNISALMILFALDLTAALIPCLSFLIRYFQSTGHSELSSLLLWTSLPDFLFHFFSSSTSFSAGFLHWEKLVLCSQLTSQSLTLFCCYSLLCYFWQCVSLDLSIRTTMWQDGFPDPPLIHWVSTSGSGVRESAFFTSVPHGF